MSKESAPIKLNPEHKGELHADLGISAGKPIPLADLFKSKRSKSPAVRRRATFAMNARSWNK